MFLFPELLPVELQGKCIIGNLLHIFFSYFDCQYAIDNFIFGIFGRYVFNSFIWQTHFVEIAAGERGALPLVPRRINSERTISCLYDLGKINFHKSQPPFSITEFSNYSL